MVDIHIGVPVNHRMPSAEPEIRFAATARPRSVTLRRKCRQLLGPVAWALLALSAPHKTATSDAG